MSGRTKFFAGLLAVVGLVFGGMLYAQQRSGGMMGMMDMMQDCPMRGAMAQGPEAALRRQEELGLTKAQVEKLEALRAEAERARAEAMESMGAMHEEVASVAGNAEFDEADARGAFERMGELHTEMGVSMLRTRHEVRSVLTPEQRETLASLDGGMMGMDMRGMMDMMRMMGSMQGGMEMMGGGMMQDGMGMEDCPMMTGNTGGRSMMQF